MCMFLKTMQCLSLLTSISIRMQVEQNDYLPLGLGAGVERRFGAGVGCPGTGLGVTGGGIEGA